MTSSRLPEPHEHPHSDLAPNALINKHFPADHKVDDVPQWDKTAAAISKVLNVPRSGSQGMLSPPGCGQRWQSFHLPKYQQEEAATVCLRGGESACEWSAFCLRRKLINGMLNNDNQERSTRPLMASCSRSRIISASKESRRHALPLFSTIFEVHTMRRSYRNCGLPELCGLARPTWMSLEWGWLIISARDGKGSLIGIS